MFIILQYKGIRQWIVLVIQQQQKKTFDDCTFVLTSPPEASTIPEIINYSVNMIYTPIPTLI